MSAHMMSQREAAVLKELADRCFEETRELPEKNDRDELVCVTREEADILKRVADAIWEELKP